MTDLVPALEAPPAELLTDYLDAPYADVVGKVRAELARNADILDMETDSSVDDFRERVLEALLAMCDSGLTGVGFPLQYGGGGDLGASVAAFQNLAYSDLSVLVKVGVQFGLFGGAIERLGTTRHHERYLRDLIAGRLLGCFAMSETGHGSNVAQLETTATYDSASQEFVVDTPSDAACKDYIGNAAAHGRVAVVFAQLVVSGECHGVHALVVPIRDEDGRTASGVEITDCGPKLGLKGVDNGRLSFSGVRVPREALLNRYADVSPDGAYSSPIEGADRRFFTMLGTLVQGRVSLAAGGVGASKVALTIAIRYAATRRQFSPRGDGVEATLLSYRTHQRRLLPLLAATYALSAAQHDVTLLLHESFTGDYVGDGRRVLESRAAGQKALATWHATRTIQEAREACGGAGYLAENRLAALKADTDVFTTFEGDNTILLQLVAKGMLSDLRRSFGELERGARGRALAAQAVGLAAERTSMRALKERVRDLAPGRRESGDLLDLDHVRALLRWREDHMTSGLARRLRRGVAAGGQVTDVFARCQDHAAAMARAQVERVTLDAFAESIERADPAVRALLTRLCLLHGLSVIEADRGWFLEHGRLSAARSKAVTTTVGRLCEELAPLAERLTDGFAIPEELVRAPIARRQ